MRPIPGNDAWSRRQRPATHRDTTPLMTSSMSTSNSQMSFVFADEATVDSYMEQSQSRPCFRDPRKNTSFELGRTKSSSANHDDKYVYDDNDEDDDDDDNDTDLGSSRPASSRLESEYAIPYSPMAPSTTFSHGPASMISHQPDLSRPITPMTLGASMTGSVISGRSSVNSFAISLSEHAVSSDEDEEYADRGAGTPGEGGSAPQLIMPSINMPSRRPFTTTGRSMGRLKVLVAGDSGKRYSPRYLLI